VKIDWKWWTYIVILCALGYGRMMERLAKESGGFWSQFGPPLGVTIISIGIVRWQRRRPLVSVWFWRVLAFFIGVVLLLGIVFSTYLIAIAVYLPGALLFATCMALSPALYALIHYSYRSPSLWANTEPNE